MDHQQFLKLMPSDTRKALQRKTNRSSLIHVAVYFAALSLFGALIANKVPGWQLLLLPHGIALAFLFNLQHECAHKTPFKSLQLNEFFGFLCGVILIQPFHWFRCFHLEHHRHTNDPKRDPELVGHSKPETWINFFWYLSTASYWKSKVSLLWQQCFYPIKDTYVPLKLHKAIKQEARVLSVLYVATLIFSLVVDPFLIWLWLVPLALGFPFLRLYHLAEHGLCPFVDDKFLNTRTVISNAFIRFVTWNMSYHAEHHLLPSVPFHRLPSLHLQLQDYLGTTSTSYTGFTKAYLRDVARMRARSNSDA